MQQSQQNSEAWWLAAASWKRDHSSHQRRPSSATRVRGAVVRSSDRVASNVILPDLSPAAVSRSTDQRRPRRRTRGDGGRVLFGERPCVTR